MYNVHLWMNVVYNMVYMYNVSFIKTVEEM